MQHYVYTYSYPDGTPFYVGKGSGRRYRVHLCDAKANRNLESWRIRVIRKLLNNGQEPLVKKVVTNVDEELALLVEQELINKYGRRDIGTGILVNSTDGGDGAININPASRAKQVKALTEGGIKTRFVKGQVPPNKGKPMPAHVMEAARKANLGRKQSAETIAKRMKNAKGKKHLLVVCPHCSKEGGQTTMNRWHFDNCKGLKIYRARATIDGKRVHLGRFPTKEEATKAMIDYYVLVGKPLPREFVKYRGAIL